MSALNRLTSLERVRDWTGVSTNSDDVLLSRLIDEVSRFILSYIQRPSVFQCAFTDSHDGHGQHSQTLRHWPVSSVSAVMVDNIPLSASLDGVSAGWVLDPWDGLPPGRPQAVHLRGYRFCRGTANVSIAYTSGFIIASEAQTVPAAGNYTVAVAAPNGSFGADQGVTYAGGAALVNVASQPGLGQYTVAGGIYGFSSHDADAAIAISYSYIPADLEHACMELVGERYRYRSRIGETSKSLGGQETVSFSQKDMPDYLKLLLQPYRRVVLV